MANIAIHGFGRIGRSLLKVALKQGLFVSVSISDIRAKAHQQLPGPSIP
jgi:glyceraldehyde 3-phosphate dehydrogenase